MLFACSVLSFIFFTLAVGCIEVEPTPTITSAAIPTRTPTPVPVSTPVTTPTPGAELDSEVVIEYLDEPHSKVQIDGPNLVFEGFIGMDSYAEFLRISREHQNEITTIVVDSGGGYTEEARKIGTWIHEHQIDVVVENLCFSSCANYIFTAAINKTIKADSIVGWHGSEQQDEHIARGLGISLEEMHSRNYCEWAPDWGETPTEKGRKEYAEHTLEFEPASVAQEQEFLDRIGVNVDALVYGFLPAQFDADYNHETHHVSGWTFSIEDMEKFGIDNVTYEGDGDYPSDEAIAEYGVIVFDVP